MKIKTNETEKEFIVGAGSPATILPRDKEIMKHKKILPITKKYQDVNKKEVKLAAKITVEAEKEEITKKLTMFITERGDIKPLLGMDWLR